MPDYGIGQQHRNWPPKPSFDDNRPEEVCRACVYPFTACIWCSAPWRKAMSQADLHRCDNRPPVTPDLTGGLTYA